MSQRGDFDSLTMWPLDMGVPGVADLLQEGERYAAVEDVDFPVVSELAAEPWPEGMMLQSAFSGTKALSMTDRCLLFCRASTTRARVSS